MSKQQRAQVTALMNWLMGKHMNDRRIGDLSVSDLIDIIDFISKEALCRQLMK